MHPDFNFGDAIESTKQGKRVARRGWNGKDMYIYLVSGSLIPKEQLRNEAKTHVGDVLAYIPGEKQLICPHIDMKAVDDSIVVGWLASQTDMLAEDWFVV